MADKGPASKRFSPWAPRPVREPCRPPKGSRNKLGEAFIEALHSDFAERGSAAIARIREENPTAYVKVCAGLLPKELKISDERELTDDELIARIRQLSAVLKDCVDLGTDDDERRLN